LSIKKAVLYFIIVLILLVISTWLCTHMGLSSEIDAREIDRVIITKLTGSQELETPIHTIIWELRLPRIILAALIGAALSMSGAAFQGLLRNPLADPYIVGTSAGAAVGGVIAIVSRVRTDVLGIPLITFFAFFGALAAMYIIYRMSLVDGKLPVETFLLAGVVVGSFLWAFVSFMLTIADKNLHEVVFWLMGSTQQATWQSVLILLIYVVIGFLGLLLLSHPLNLLTLGDETAEHLGVNIERTKLWIIILASLLTAAAVSVSGLIGFVGLMIPHVVRMIIGADHRLLIPTSAFTGALFLMWVDTFARSTLPTREIPVGILTAIMGAPFFLHLLRKRKMNL
jgi:iron complex transport system permease protein